MEGRDYPSLCGACTSATVSPAPGASQYKKDMDKWMCRGQPPSGSGSGHLACELRLQDLFSLQRWLWGPTCSSPGLHSRATSRWNWALHIVHVRKTTEETRGIRWNQKGSGWTSGKSSSPLWRQDSSGARSLQRLHRLCSWKCSKLDMTKTWVILPDLRAGLPEQKVGERTSNSLPEET